MAMTWWRYPTRRFQVGPSTYTVESRARTDGLHSRLLCNGTELAHDRTPHAGPEAVRNHALATVLPDGRGLAVELGWMGVWTTGCVARIDGVTAYESHPGRVPAYPERHRATVAEARTNDDSVFATGALAPQNRIPFAVDVVTGLMFFFIAKATDLQTAALVGVAVGLGLILFQRLTRIDVTGGLVLFGIVMMAISAGLAMLSGDDEWIKQRGTITGLIGAAFFLFDGWRGGPYIGRGLARYMPYADIDRARLAIAFGIVGALMAGLNYLVARLASTDHWLFYKTFLDTPVVFVLAAGALAWARRGPGSRQPAA